MSTIDTVESVLEIVAYLREEGMNYTAAMLTRYAALLKAVNRPVTEEQVIAAVQVYYGGTGLQENMPNMGGSLEAHMAALRGEVGK